MRFSKIVKERSNRTSLLSIFLLYGFCVSLPGLAGEVTDASGVKVHVPANPKRIVALAPSLAELAADFSGENLDRIVGVSEYTDYPPALKKRPSIGSYAHFNIEAVVGLKPDLVLATSDGNPKDQVLRLRELGLPVVVVATTSFRDIEQSMRIVGSAMDAPAVGERMAKQFHASLDRIREKAKGRSRLRVLIQVGDAPLVAAGGGSFLNEALEAVGATNIYSSGAQAYPRPSLESVVTSNPDVILVMALGAELKTYQTMAANWKRIPGLKAVKAGDVRVVQGDAILRPTLRLLEGLSLLERAVYGTK